VVVLLWTLGRQSNADILTGDGLLFVSALITFIRTTHSNKFQKRLRTLKCALAISEIKQYIEDFKVSARNTVSAGNLTLHPNEVKKLMNGDDRTLIGFGRYWIVNFNLPHRLVGGVPLNIYNINVYYIG